MKHDIIESTGKKIRPKKHVEHRHGSLAAENDGSIKLPELTLEQRKIQIETFSNWQDWNDESMDVYESYLTSE